MPYENSTLQLNWQQIPQRSRIYNLIIQSSFKHVYWFARKYKLNSFKQTCKNRKTLNTNAKVEAEFMLQMSYKAKFDNFALTWAPSVVEDQNIHLHHCNTPCQHLLSQLMCKHPFHCVKVLLFWQEEILLFFTTQIH
jgi:hypothetical protein